DMETLRGCAGCVRRHVIKKSVYLLFTAHFVWPFFALPLSIFVVGISLAPGHSYQFEFEPDYEYRDGDSRWRATFASLSFFLLWMFPLFGLAITAIAWRVNRRHTPDAYCASGGGFVMSVLAHSAFLVWASVVFLPAWLR